MKNSKKIMRAALGLGCLLFTACMQVEDIDDGQTQAPPPQQPTPIVKSVTNLSLPLNLKVEPKSEMHKYQVRLFSPTAGELPASLLVKRSVGPDGKNPVIFVLKNIEGSFVDETTAEGVRYRYEWGLQDGASVRMLGAGEAKIPVDLVFAENASSELKNFELAGGRVRFQKNARVFTRGQRVDWKIDSLQGATNAILATFDDGATAEKQVSGRSGGRISIVTVQAIGELQVEMRGERGGQGADGAEGAKGRNGANGALVPGSAGERVFGAPIGAYFRCDQYQQRGQNGFRGGKGGNGGEGMKGGDSGLFTYRGPLDDFELNVVAVEGAGGEGGAPGSGGAGGDPGKPSHVTNDGVNPMRYQDGLKAFYDPQSCRPPAVASPGGIGDPGEDGHEGIAGSRQAACVNGIYR